MQQTIQPLASSFRDPSGFVFQKDGVIYRQVNKIFREDFDYFIKSGCYEHLKKNEWIIPHEEITENLSGSEACYKTLLPQRIPFISYPYEWCFGMMKDAARLTLQIAKECIPFGIILKDATPYNIQWWHGKPTFIDTLSFERYEASKPWIAYRQFCESFVSTLLLMHYTGQPTQSLLLAYPDGIPLPVTKALLPWHSKLSLHTFLHIHLHERLSRASIKKEQQQETDFSEKKLIRLLDSLQSLTESLQWKPKETPWGNYYDEAKRRKDYVDEKKNIVAQWISELQGIGTAMDLGSNEGEFSYLLAKERFLTISTDSDHTAINRLYQKIKNNNEENILPILIDLANPSPCLGLNNNERSSFIERAHVDLSLALALVHHLAIGKNIPFEKIAGLFEKISTYLIVEFIPKEDQKIQFMLKQKKDIYHDYNEENFLKAFEKNFFVQKKQQIGDSGRTLYQMKRHND